VIAQRLAQEVIQRAGQDEEIGDARREGERAFPVMLFAAMTSRFGAAGSGACAWMAAGDSAIAATKAIAAVIEIERPCLCEVSQSMTRGRAD
jgi:hypothetical protein